MSMHKAMKDYAKQAQLRHDIARKTVDQIREQEPVLPEKVQQVLSFAGLYLALEQQICSFGWSPPMEELARTLRVRKDTREQLINLIME